MAIFKSTMLRDTSASVYVLVMLFAMSSWIDINGVWTELPILVNYLPESWNLPSYLVIIIQVANIGPLLFTVANRVAPSKVVEWPVIYVILAVGAVSCLLLSFFWDYTSVILGEEHSTGLLTLSALLALVDCTSSVVYLPYMAAFKAQYMTAFYVGEGLSGLVPGVLGLIQGASGDPECVNRSVVIENETTGENYTEWQVWPEYKDPRYSVDLFFILLFLLFIVSTVAFTMIHCMPFAKRARIDNSFEYHVTKEDLAQDRKSNDVQSESSLDVEVQVSHVDGKDNFSFSKLDELYIGKTGQDNYLDGNNRSLPDTSNTYIKTGCEDEVSTTSGSLVRGEGLGRGKFLLLLIVVAIMNGLQNGVLPSTQSYSCLPYGNLAYNLQVRLSLFANPLACFVFLFVTVTSLPVIMSLFASGLVLAAYQLALAALSPDPPLQDSSWGVFLVVFTGVLLTGVFSFLKVAIASIMHACGGHSALLWTGVATQLGSLCGAVITFVIINVYNMLESAPPCPV